MRPESTHPSDLPTTPRVLLVDDDPGFLSACRRALDVDGYDIHEEARLAVVKDILADERFDLVVADADGDDIESAEFVRQVKYHYPHTDIVLLIPLGSSASALDALRAGAFDCVSKPLPRDVLRATVRRALQTQSMKREISIMQAELLKKDRLATVGTMAGMIAHRMRNPLSIIRMCAEQLEDALSGRPELLENVAAIRDKTGALELLTRDFMDYARASRLNRAPGRLAAVVDTALDASSAKFRIQKIDIRRTGAPGRLEDISIDADLLAEVVTNILDNAAEAMGGAGWIHIDLGPGEGGAGQVLTIRNSGSVLPDNLRESIFEPFFTTKETGVGLGLAIARQAVEGHGGRIEAWGDAAEGTTTFRLTFPGAAAPKPT